MPNLADATFGSADWLMHQCDCEVMSRLGVLGQMAAWLAIIVFSDLAAEPLSEPNAVRIIDEALRSANAVSKYIATSYTDSGTTSVITTYHVKNDDSGRWVRLERIMFVNGRESERLVRLQRPDGVWQLEDGRALRFDYSIRLEPPIPARLTTGRRIWFQLRTQGNTIELREAVYSIERGIRYFDREADRLVVAIDSQLEADLLNPESEIRHSMLEAIRARPLPIRPNDHNEVHPASPEEVLEDFYPVRYVYIRDKESGLLLSFESFSCTGKPMASISFQDLQLPPAFEDGLFEIPSGAEIIPLAGPDDYRKLRMQSSK